jgi:hypothetical protein
LAINAHKWIHERTPFPQNDPWDNPATPESWKGSPKVNFPAIQCSSKVDIALKALLNELTRSSPLAWWTGRCGIVGIVSDIGLLMLVPAFRVYRLMAYFPTLFALLHSAV